MPHRFDNPQSTSSDVTVPSGTPNFRYLLKDYADPTLTDAEVFVLVTVYLHGLSPDAARSLSGWTPTQFKKVYGSALLKDAG